MSPSKNTQTIDPTKWGVSFSLKQCRNFDIDADKTLNWLLGQGWRRFRLMSYWDEHEKSPGNYDFSALDTQIKHIEKAGGIITLCLGARQPRWPENHWPEWAWKLSKHERSTALLDYIQVVMERYKDRDCIVSWQLENEALLEQFGQRPEIDRQRLQAEINLVKQLDPSRPVIMTTSTSWGVPFRRPIPDIVGFSFYQIVYSGGRYTTSFHKPWLDRWRARAIRALHDRPSFIHELQLEPWGPKNIWDMSVEEQDKSMSPHQIETNIALAKKTNLYPIDLWGGEWWYWRWLQEDGTVWQTLKSTILNS